MIREGRVITLEFEDYYFVTCYTPNSKKKSLLELIIVWNGKMLSLPI